MEITDIRLAQAARQYSEAIGIHEDLPASARLWVDNYVTRALNELWGVTTVEKFYAKCIADIARAEPDRTIKIVSLGCGDGQVEIKTCRQLLNMNVSNIYFEGADIASGAIDRAKSLVASEGFEDFFELRVSTYDSLFEKPLDVVIANQVLHHFTDLEGLFDMVKAAIGSHGVFLSSDMIGRNGHMLWPEALAIVDRLWARLDDKYKYNHILQRFEPQYSNWDNSKEANEGIRAQDILPELLKRFQFEKFLATGNLGVTLFGRHFGSNFDPSVPEDLALIDQINETDFNLIDMGYLKPVLMYASMSNRNRPSEFYRHWSPEFCLRAESPIADTASTTFLLNEIIQFGERLTSTECLRTGWSSPEVGGVWSNDTHSEIRIPLKEPIRDTIISLDIWGMQFDPKQTGSKPIGVTINGIDAGTISFTPSSAMATVSVELSEITRHLIVRLDYSECLSPSELGLGDDSRLLAFHLLALRPN